MEHDKPEDGGTLLVRGLKAAAICWFSPETPLRLTGLGQPGGSTYIREHPRSSLDFVARETTEDLTDADMEGLLHAAVEDEREGRIVHCADKDELRIFLESNRPYPA